MEKDKLPKLYALYSPKEKCFMQVSIELGDSRVIFELEKYEPGGIIWTCDSIEVAKEVCNREERVPWFECSYNRPIVDEWYYGRLEVINLT